MEGTLIARINLVEKRLRKKTDMTHAQNLSITPS